MKTNLTMAAPEAIDPRPVFITAVAEMEDEELDALQNTHILPDRFHSRLQAYTGIKTAPNFCMIESYNAMLCVCKGRPDGLAVVGTQSIHYAGYIPDAKAFLENRLMKMADFVCEFSHVPDAKLPHNLTMNRLGGLFRCKVTGDNGIGEMLLKTLSGRHEISDIRLQGDSFAIYYTPENEQKSVQSSGTQLTLSGLSVCRLEDIHLCHTEEDHDIATIAELYPDTLTEQGRKDWADVLSAKVERICNGFHGIHVELSGCEPERVGQFACMLAGYCSAENYDRWVNQGEEQEQAVPEQEDPSVPTMQ